jgi:hypothetical protein
MALSRKIFEIESVGLRAKNEPETSIFSLSAGNSAGEDLKVKDKLLKAYFQILVFIF